MAHHINYQTQPNQSSNPSDIHSFSTRFLLQQGLLLVCWRIWHQSRKGHTLRLVEIFHARIMMQWIPYVFPWSSGQPNGLTGTPLGSTFPDVLRNRGVHAPHPWRSFTQVIIEMRRSNVGPCITKQYYLYYIPWNLFMNVYIDSDSGTAACLHQPHLLPSE